MNRMEIAKFMYNFLSESLDKGMICDSNINEDSVSSFVNEWNDTYCDSSGVEEIKVLDDNSFLIIFKKGQKIMLVRNTTYFDVQCFGFFCIKLKTPTPLW